MKLIKSVIDQATYESIVRERLEEARSAGRIGEEKYQERLDRLELVLQGDKNAKPERAVLWAEQPTGLGLRLNPRGTKTWVLSYRFAGRSRLMKLGRYGDRRTLHWAKDRANEELRTVDEKTDPLIERKKERWKNLEARTVAQLCDRYLENHAKVAKKTWKTDEARIKKYIKPKLGHLRIEEVTRARVGRFYREVGATTPVEANRLVALLSIMFNRAPDWGLSPEGTPNPAKMRKDSMYREERRDRPIRTDELPRLIKAIEAEQSVYVRGALLLLLMTGLRKGEVLKARWDDVDLGRGTLHLPETKAGKPRHVQLSSEAVELIRELPRMVGNPHLFPSPSKAGAPLYDIKKPWARVRKVAKCEDLRIHDIRHSVATWLADGGFPAQTIQAALGHKNIEQTMGYVHASDQAPREAVETIGERIARHRKSRRGSASLEGAAEP